MAGQREKYKEEEETMNSGDCNLRPGREQCSLHCTEDLWRQDHPFWFEIEVRTSSWLLCSFDFQLEP